MLRSSATLWVVLRNAQSVVEHLSHFRYLSPHFGAELPKVSWFRSYCNTFSTKMIGESIPMFSLTSWTKPHNPLSTDLQTITMLSLHCSTPNKTRLYQAVLMLSAILGKIKSTGFYHPYTSSQEQLIPYYNKRLAPFLSYLPGKLHISGPASFHCCTLTGTTSMNIVSWKKLS